MQVEEQSPVFLTWKVRQEWPGVQTCPPEMALQSSGWHGCPGTSLPGGVSVLGYPVAAFASFGASFVNLLSAQTQSSMMSPLLRQEHSHKDSTQVVNFPEGRTPRGKFTRQTHENGASRSKPPYAWTPTSPAPRALRRAGCWPVISMNSHRRLMHRPPTVLCVYKTSHIFLKSEPGHMVSDGL